MIKPAVTRCCFVAFVAFCVSVMGGGACASNGGLIQVPMMTAPNLGRGVAVYSNQSGLRVAVDTTWAGHRGYRPVKVTVTAPKVVAADTQLTINFYGSGLRYGERVISVEQDFELPRGSTSVSTTLTVPQYLDWKFLGWEFWVDGEMDKELGLVAAGYNAGGGNNLAMGALMLKQNQNRLTNIVPDLSGYSTEVHPIDHLDLPKRWLDYSSLDVLVTTARFLQLVEAGSPGRFSELRKWIRAGGTLWVFDVGEDFSRLAEVESLLAPNLGVRPAEGDSEGEGLGAWRFLTLADSPKRIDALVKLTMDAGSPEESLSVVEMQNRSEPEQAVDSRHWFRARAYGLGTVVAFQHSPSNRLVNFEDCEAALQKSTLNENLHWASRHGNDPGSGNSSFNNLLIPDVGTAPVFEFQLLISLFVIGIGPVNYWLLKRRNQLPLLLLTVPLAALLATVLLFGYGFLADGVGVRVRVRSMTLLDQRVGEVASWARLSYYAGIAPGEGLKIPADTAFYPISPSRSQHNRFGRQYLNQQRAIAWDGEQHLTRGWLTSRTPTQYLAISSRSTDNRLVFDASPKELRVTNRLGASVLALVVQDHEGNIFVGDAIDEKGSVVLTPSTYHKGVVKLRHFLVANLPQVPASYVDSRRPKRDSYEIGVKGSLMEIHFEAIVSPLATGWGNETYVAITATGIEVPLGLAKVNESNSFHVVRGTW